MTRSEAGVAAGDEPRVVREQTGAVVTLVLNRPTKLNALDRPTFNALDTHLKNLENDPSVACVVLEGAGKSFCAGHDLSTIHALPPGAVDHYEAEVVDRLEQLPMPTIAKIRGHCYTGGLELALACDLLIAADSASLGDTHGQWGLIPVWGMSVRLPERVGRSRAKELMFTSRRITGEAAAEIGLVDTSVSDDSLNSTVEALSAEIAANAAGSNRVVKRLLGSNPDLGRRGALQFERSMPFGFPREEMDARMAAPPGRA